MTSQGYQHYEPIPKGAALVEIGHNQEKRTITLLEIRTDGRFFLVYEKYDQAYRRKYKRYLVNRDPNKNAVINEHLSFREEGKTMPVTHNMIDLIKTHLSGKTILERWAKRNNVDLEHSESPRPRPIPSAGPGQEQVDMFEGGGL